LLVIWIVLLFRGINISPLFIQDYVKTKIEQITVWVCKKRHTVSLAVPTDKKEREAKSKRATFANFIHQKDAGLACHVILKLIKHKVPVYTVHDNFLTPAVYAHLLPEIYAKPFYDLTPPLYIVNRIIYDNLIFQSEKSLSFTHEY
jgi:hypothetical protein